MKCRRGTFEAKLTKFPDLELRRIPRRRVDSPSWSELNFVLHLFVAAFALNHFVPTGQRQEVLQGFARLLYPLC
jgi:hypothetical protein